MILVDVTVPAINKQFDFRLDENAYVADAVLELGQILVHRYSGEDTSMVNEMMLCDCEKNVVLTMGRTLKNCGIGNGSRLMLL